MDPDEKKQVYSHDPRVGKFNLRYELLESGADRPLVQAIFGLCSEIHEVSENESGRGKTYIATSVLFQPLIEGDEIPEYRIECELARRFTDEENAKAVVSGGFKFYATRKIIVRVPTIGVHAVAHIN